MFLLLILGLFGAQLVSGQGPYRPYYCADTYGYLDGCESSAAAQFAKNPNSVVHARVAWRNNETGWTELDIETNGKFEDSVQAYFAGLMEGFLSAFLIKDFRHNVGLSTPDDHSSFYCHNFSQFILANLNTTITQIHQHSADPYWRQIGLTLYQLAGIDEGYSGVVHGKEILNTKPNFSLNPCGAILLNLFAEFGDLQMIQNPGVRVKPMDHCSALVKWVPEKGEVYVSQNTWTMYSMMTRLLKKYTLNYRVSQAQSVVLSSYPGVVVSFDDFYITSERLVVQETSIENFRVQNYHGLNAGNIVFEFVRNAVANRLAKSGPEWAAIFSRNNSGTYNNQFMIVDYKRLTNHGTHLEDNFLTVLEQMPNLVLTKDRTEHVRANSYWASYNIPAFPEIYEYSGTGDQYDKYGDYYSYDKTARALIFARDHSKVTNLTTMYSLMRYNDFQRDPLAICDLCTPAEPNGIYAIAARGDLNDPNGNCPLYQLNQHMLGAIDAKITSAKLAPNLEFIAVSGPTDQQEPAFDWTKVPQRNQIPHRHQPDLWNFKPVRTNWRRSVAEPEFEYFNFDL